MIYITDPSTNFMGNMKYLKELALLSEKAGATYFKPQIYDASQLYSPDNPYYNLQLKCSLTLEQVEDIYSYCKDIKIEPMFSIFQTAHLRWLDEVGVEYIKIAARMNSDLEFLNKVKEYGFKPIISLSKEHQLPFFTYEDMFGKDVIRLYTVGKYPSDISDYSLEAIRICQGLSNHVPNIYLDIAATAIGCNYIEHHIRYSKTTPNTPDYSSSINISELEEMINICNKISKIRYISDIE